MARAGKLARSGARAARVVRMVRLVRMVRIFKLFSMRKNRRKFNEDGTTSIVGEEATAENNPSAVGQRLSDSVSKRVIVGVLSLLIFAPLLEIVETDSSQYMFAESTLFVCMCLTVRYSRNWQACAFMRCGSERISPLCTRCICLLCDDGRSQPGMISI